MRWAPGWTRVNRSRRSAMAEALIRTFPPTAWPSCPCRLSRPSCPFRLLEEDRLAIAPIDLLEHMPDLVERAIRPRAIQHGRYDVPVRGRGLVECIQPLRDQAGVTGGAQPSHALPLGPLRLVANPQNFHRSLGLFHKVVDPDDGPPSLLQLRLEAHRGVRNLPLEPAGFYRLDDPALGLDL